MNHTLPPLHKNGSRNIQFSGEKSNFKPTPEDLLKSSIMRKIEARKTAKHYREEVKEVWEEQTK